MLESIALHGRVQPDDTGIIDIVRKVCVRAATEIIKCAATLVKVDALTASDAALEKVPAPLEPGVGKVCLSALILKAFREQSPQLEGRAPLDRV